jgi:hypothetical protein
MCCEDEAISVFHWINEAHKLELPNPAEGDFSKHFFRTSGTAVVPTDWTTEAPRYFFTMSSSYAY